MPGRVASTPTAAALGGGRWTPEQAAEFAARRDFRLAALLAKDRRVLATARRLGLFAAMRSRQSTTAVADDSPASGAPQRRSAQTQTLRSTANGATENSRQRRSRLRADAFYKRKREASEHAHVQSTNDGADAESMDGVESTTSVPTDAQALTDPPPAPSYEALARELLAAKARNEKLCKVATYWKTQYDKMRDAATTAAGRPAAANAAAQRQQPSSTGDDGRAATPPPPAPLSFADAVARSRRGAEPPATGASRCT